MSHSCKNVAEWSRSSSGSVSNGMVKGSSRCSSSKSLDVISPIY